MEFDTFVLRILCQVMSDGSFSRAAKSLGISQPAVSQQIAKLEHKVGGKLFQRVGRDIVPTPLGQDVHRFAVSLLESVDGFGDHLEARRTVPRGLVRYAMPESCQWTPHYRKIMSQIREVPEIQFQIQILSNDQILKELLAGKIDFGFVVGERVSPELRFQKFGDEAYSAVATDRELLRPVERDGAPARWVTYPGWESYFEAWARAHGVKRALSSRLGVPTVWISTLAGAIHAVQEGAGLTIVPTHCVRRELDQRALLEWCPKPSIVATSPIYIARRLDDRLPRRAEVVLEMLKRSKAHELTRAKA